MRFEHDIYDIDVYSLCESVYYSCNNDEYDYVLECVNDWIMNGYDDNILLEDIVLNEVSSDFVYRAIQSKFKKLFPNLDFDTELRKLNRKSIGDHEPTPVEKFFNYTYNLSVKNYNKENLRKMLGKNPDIVLTYKDPHSTIIQFVDIANASPKVYQDHLDFSKERLKYSVKKSQTAYEEFNKTFGRKRGKLYDFDKLLHMTPDNFAPLKKPDEEKLSQTQPNTSPKPEPSPDPLSDNKGKPAQTPPTPPSRLSRATTWVKNNKVKTAVGLGAAAIGGSIYAYKQYKNRPRSVIAKRIAALRGVYKKFMLEAQRNPKKANVFKRIAAKILSVIDKLLGYLQNKADGR